MEKQHIPLEAKEDGKEFAKNFLKLKKNAIRAKIEKNVSGNKEKPEHGCIYIGHIPHGFYETQIQSFFKQFGKVSNVHLCRSKKTGKSKGFAFVDFEDLRVAKIAAQTMNNHLMFNRRITAAFVPSNGKANQIRHKNFNVTEVKYPLKFVYNEVNTQKNLNLSENEHTDMCKRYIANVKTTLIKLKNLGILYEFKPVDDDHNLYETHGPQSKKPKIKKEKKDIHKMKKRTIIKKKNLIKNKK